MITLCPEQQTCEDFTVGHKRRVHHIRVTERCLRFDDGSCPHTGRACDLEKIRRLKGEKPLPGPSGIHLMIQDMQEKKDES